MPFLLLAYLKQSNLKSERFLKHENSDFMACSWVPNPAPFTVKNKCIQSNTRLVSFCLEIDIKRQLYMSRIFNNWISNTKVMKKFHELFAQPSYLHISKVFLNKMTAGFII